MDAFRSITTKLEVRQFSTEKVSSEVKSKILEAARLTQSGMNSQHWRFIIVERKENLKTLAADSTSGKWVEGADFAIMVLTDPRLGFHMIDAGRVVQSMQITAWNFGVASGVFTGIDEAKLRRDFNIPADLNPTMMLGFGFPQKKIFGKKKRKPISELAFQERYGDPLNTENVYSKPSRP